MLITRHNGIKSLKLEELLAEDTTTGDCTLIRTRRGKPLSAHKSSNVPLFMDSTYGLLFEVALEGALVHTSTPQLFATLDEAKEAFLAKLVPLYFVPIQPLKKWTSETSWTTIEQTDSIPNGYEVRKEETLLICGTLHKALKEAGEGFEL